MSIRQTNLSSRLLIISVLLEVKAFICKCKCCCHFPSNAYALSGWWHWQLFYWNSFFWTNFLLEQLFISYWNSYWNICWSSCLSVIESVIEAVIDYFFISKLSQTSWVSGAAHVSAKPTHLYMHICIWKNEITTSL